jgi:hypothetical protein
MITDEQVRDAITILHAFVAGELDDISDALACELVDAAYDVLGAPGVTAITCEIDETPFVPSL